MKPDRPLELVRAARELAADYDDFRAVRGPGVGNRRTNDFMERLGRRATKLFGEGVRERRLCGENALAVDFYFDEEATIVEVALGLPNPASEFEKDILKAIMAQANGVVVHRLVFVSRPGAKKKCDQPGRRVISEWLARSHGIRIEVHELDGEPRASRRRQ